MALDDVAIRAMSKTPEDRYPSAGDLGRAAVAALSGSHPDLPERTVATGAAATRTAETIAIEPQDGHDGRGRTWLALAGSMVAVAVIIAVVLALGSGGGGSGDPETNRAVNSTPKQRERHESAPPLSRTELIAKADTICTDSQSSFEEVRAEFPEAKNEEGPDVAYSEALVAISSPAVRRFEGLDPPSSVRRSYEQYVAAQRRVHKYDVQALHAARAEHSSEYLAARERRDNGQLERYELAREIGLKTCSASPG
jgi:hypothetical protein